MAVYLKGSGQRKNTGQWRVVRNYIGSSSRPFAKRPFSGKVKEKQSPDQWEKKLAENRFGKKIT